CLLEIDDVDAVALAENILFHFRIPTLGLMSKVDTSLQKLFHCNRRQINLRFEFFRMVFFTINQKPLTGRRSPLAGPQLYLLENWKRLRAPGCPYFLRSFMRGSRVRKPSFFKVPRSSVLNSTSARAMPCWTAPAWPCGPPPSTRTRTSNLFRV